MHFLFARSLTTLPCCMRPVRFFNYTATRPAAVADLDAKQAKLCRTQPTNNLSKFIWFARHCRRAAKRHQIIVELNLVTLWHGFIFLVAVPLIQFISFWNTARCLGGRHHIFDADTFASYEHAWCARGDRSLCSWSICVKCEQEQLRANVTTNLPLDYIVRLSTMAPIKGSGSTLQIDKFSLCRYILACNRDWSEMVLYLFHNSTSWPRGIIGFL